jgi:hypothetical protein
MPAIAVNNDGVVAVAWYDRRDNPDNLGYFERLSASLDGGVTWLPSIRVSANANLPEVGNNRFNRTAVHQSVDGHREGARGGAPLTASGPTHGIRTSFARPTRASANRSRHNAHRLLER